MIFRLNKFEFGDFQTPSVLADLMCIVLKEKFHFSPDCIIEPTCGKGNILLSAIKAFPNSRKNIGIELNSTYLEELNNTSKVKNLDLTLINENFFSIDFSHLSSVKSENILLIGNPPWVTNSGLGVVNSNNLPQKSNFKNFKGMDAITGKSNFDLSEYILLKLIDSFINHHCIIAFLCKTSVARKILSYLWDNNIKAKNAEIYPIDSKKYFNAAVDACFFIIKLNSDNHNLTCNLYQSIEDRKIVSILGISNGTLINNINKFHSYKTFIGKSEYIWRNGIKHDASKVMEFTLGDNNNLVSSYGKIIDIEQDLLYPLLKSSDLANSNMFPRKWVIVTQKYVGQNTIYIREYYPKTWKYLNENINAFINRKSSIYKNKPLFSIFSIGEYSFFPYKIAISGLYKHIKFNLLKPYQKKPIQVDDTCNFISCATLEEANLIYELLNSDIVTHVLESLIFWDSKRPITTETLNKIDLKKIAEKLGYSIEYRFLYSSK